jgi:hypothetical protein
LAADQRTKVALSPEPATIVVVEPAVLHTPASAVGEIRTHVLVDGSLISYVLDAASYRSLNWSASATRGFALFIPA